MVKNVCICSMLLRCKWAAHFVSSAHCYCKIKPVLSLHEASFGSIDHAFTHGMKIFKDPDQINFFYK